MTQDEYGETLKFYADRATDPQKRTAMNVQCTFTRAGVETLSVELVQIQTGRKPNWSDKISLQLTKTELKDMCRVLFGLKDQMKGSYHGDAHNKGIAVYDNGPQGAAVSVSEKGRKLYHILTPDDRLDLGVFVLRRLAHFWKVTPSDAIALLRQASAMERE